MWNTNVRLDYLSGLIRNEINNYSLTKDASIFDNIIKELHIDFPECNDEELLKIIQLCIKTAENKNEEKSELVITAPESFKLKSKRIKDTLSELLTSAKQSVLMTGYSVSEYFDGLIDVITSRSRQGVYFSIYINDLKKQKDDIEKLIAYKGKFLKIYNFQKKEDDKMAALHAKIIVADERKCLISSANLSYHGLEGNIEMGLMLDSKKKAAQIKDLFNELKRMRTFVEA